LVLDNLPDEALMKKLEQHRDRGRDDFPIRAMWNTLVAGVVFQHPSIESLLRELRRNAQLRQVCGLDLGKGMKAVPHSWGFSRFLGQVIAHRAVIREMFDTLVEGVAQLPPDFGVSLTAKLTGTRANDSEVVEGHRLLEGLEEKHAEIVERCGELAADRGYDDTKLIRKLWDEWQAVPVIDIRNLWRDGEKSKLVSGFENIVYDYRGTVSCVCMKSGCQREMAYGGFERDRLTLKYRCPARHCGYGCEGQESCPVGKAVRIPLEEDRRVFTLLARSSLKWDRLYDKRTSVERVSSRLDTSFGFEKHTIRGLTKRDTRCCLALVVMLAMAVGRIKANQADKTHEVWCRPPERGCRIGHE
jgi:hypothetical protein